MQKVLKNGVLILLGWHFFSFRIRTSNGSRSYLLTCYLLLSFNFISFFLIRIEEGERKSLVKGVVVPAMPECNHPPSLKFQKDLFNKISGSFQRYRAIVPNAGKSDKTDEFVGFHIALALTLAMGNSKN